MPKLCFSCENVGWRSALSLTGWLLGYFMFLVLGAFLFWKIESPYDLDNKKKAREVFLEKLRFYNISTNNTMIRDLINTAIAANDVGGLDLADYTKEVGSWWTLGASFFFASTIVTTIGYGNIAPVSHGGRSCTILYALVGIPFTGIILAKVGRVLSNIIKRADSFIEARIKQCFPKLSQREDTKKYVRLTQLLFVLAVFVVFFWIIPAICITYTEKWLFSDAAYFCFISLTTIGLGDIVPGASSEGLTFTSNIQLSTVRKGAYQVSIILYLILGLAALTIILNLIGSLIKNVAETTIKHGKSTMVSAGNKISGAGGKIAETGGRLFGGVGHGGQMIANSVRKKFSRINGNSDPPTPSSSGGSPDKLKNGLHDRNDSKLGSLSECQENEVEVSEVDDSTAEYDWNDVELEPAKRSSGSVNESFVSVSLDVSSVSTPQDMPKPGAC